MEDFTLFFLLLILILILVFLYMQMSRKRGSASSTGAGQQPQGKNQQIAEDVKATQTSRIADACSIVDELSSTSPGYRHYAELIGTTQATSDLVAPYSKHHVAYYDLRAFRIENIGGSEVETLIAHEKSIDPFYFTDSSSDEKVYVDLKSFDDDIILINSANRIEGPDSDFAHAVGSNAKSSSSGSNAFAIVGELKEKAAGLASTLRSKFRPPTPELALADGGVFGFERHEYFISAPATQYGSRDAKDNMAFAAAGPGMGGYGGGRGRGGFNPSPYGNLGSFLGGNWGNVGGPYGNYWPRQSSTGDIGGMLLGMGLGALIGSLTETAFDQPTTSKPPTPQSQFRGYRIVEDVVPLNYQVYALGELYRNADTFIIGRSLSESYPSSFFATKPEAEVVSHLEGKR